MEAHWVSINGQEFVITDAEAAIKMMQAMVEAASGTARWVEIPARGSRRPQVLITAMSDCIIETVELSDAEEAGEGPRHDVSFEWPEFDFE